MLKSRMSVITGMILFVAGMRLIPHPPNFTPVLAMALFGGAYLTSRRAAFAVPLVAMLLVDLLMGLHHLIPVVYGSILLITCLGFVLRTRKGVVPVAAAAVASSVLFFVVTNFGVWALGSFYPKTVAGLIACYVAAIPYFHSTLLGTVVYSAFLFGGFILAERAFPRLREPAYGLSA
ncbi:MAG: DUF6580 family putative transport protein [bacterium]|nr:DUF6580 family putative transport protein [bacterium]